MDVLTIILRVHAPHACTLRFITPFLYKCLTYNKYTMDNNKLWEVELLRTITANGKDTVRVYGIIYSRTVINPNTGLYDDHWIETQVKASDVFRDITKQDIFSSMQLCFYSTKPVDYVTVENGKLKTIKL